MCYQHIDIYLNTYLSNEANKTMTKSCLNLACIECFENHINWEN